MRRAARRALWLLAPLMVAGALGGCLNIKSADLFKLQRTGHGPTLVLLVNDGGTISCNGGSPKPLADPLLLQARDLAPSLDSIAGLKLPIRHSVFHYYVVLPYGSLTFPDTAGLHHPVLAEVEQFALKASQQACHLPG